NGHTAKITDMGTNGPAGPYLVMELLEGQSLRALLDEAGQLPLELTINIALQVCECLTEAHGHGIIHRDLKPENIFLTMRDNTSDFVKVLDFGIAKSTEAERVWSRRLTSPGMAMGTPEYMAPEQAAGKPADERCDVYAVGAILYEALTGVAPYEGDNFMEVLTKKAMAEPVPVQQLRPEVPEVVAALVLRAMARDPQERPASMEVFEYELTKCMAGRGEAVANILGMRTDHELVVSLNPGLALPPAPADVERRAGGGRHRSAVDAVLLEDESGKVAGSLADMRENDVVGMPSDAAQNTVLTPVRVRSRLGIVGWLGGATAVLVAAGVILYVASGDDSATTRDAVAGVTVAANDPARPPTGQPSDPDTTGPDRPRTGGTDTARPPDSGAAAIIGPDQGASQAGQQVSGGQDQGSSQTGQVQVQDPSQAGQTGAVERQGMAKEEAEALLKQANGKRLSDPDGAVKLYQQVASKGTGQVRRNAYLGMAKVAFERKDWDGAINHARRAGGGIEADRILGHAYFRKGDVAQARKHYQAVLDRDPSDNTIRTLLDKLK
ncbi:MAG TPA: protein kinase, partial [Haliangium sp.]|nr:protein kinase [Haliangium sp.]